MLSPPGLHTQLSIFMGPSYKLVNASLSDVRECSHQLYEWNWSRFVILDQKSEVCDYADSHDSLVNCAHRLPEARNNIISHYYADRERLTHSNTNSMYRGRVLRGKVRTLPPSKEGAITCRAWV